LDKKATIKIFPYEFETAWKCAHTVETTVHEEGEIKLCLDCAALLDAGADYEKMKGRP
jgi:hypothetical protein